MIEKCRQYNKIIIFEMSSKSNNIFNLIDYSAKMGVDAIFLNCENISECNLVLKKNYMNNLIHLELSEDNKFKYEEISKSFI